METFVYKLAKVFYFPKLNLFGETYARGLLTALCVLIFLGPYIVGGALPSNVSEQQMRATLAANALYTQALSVLLFLASLPLMYSHRLAILTIIRRNLFLVILLGWAVLSITWAFEPAIAFRRIVRLGLIVSVVVTIVAAMPSKRAFLKVVMFMSGAVLFADMALLALGGSRDVDGLFIGVHVHKNWAGSFGLIAAVIWMFSIFMAQRWGQIITRCAFFAMSIVILFVSGSKTSLAILPVVLPIAFFIEMALRRGQRTLLYAMGAMGVGSALVALAVIIVGPERFVTLVFGDPTLTGRTEIWAFMFSKIAESPLLGWGYGSFWEVGDAGPSQQTSSYVIPTINQAHNGYIDVIAQLGYVGIVLLVPVIVMPCIQLFEVAKTRRQIDRNVGVFIALLVAGLIHNITESSLFVPEHAMWVFTLFSLLQISVYHRNFQEERLRHRARVRQKKSRRSRPVVAGPAAPKPMPPSSPPRGPVPAGVGLSAASASPRSSSGSRRTALRLRKAHAR
ncbi:O-antigen ligase family protein [Marinivivus vitaminiproducens]|uniref:O-antigen ligase family protein n=1 Tax=Marinivivus vitaminiproducens TaxID=3035935 RepID=UPI00279DCD96|nr:O-antigen ligase [Geminicoccaceae bacterium SCSIO 64248]